jgi:L-rhamnose isomerase
VSKNALAYLRRTKGGQMDVLETYRANEDRIRSVARRLVVAGVSGTPLVLGAAYFV